LGAECPFTRVILLKVCCDPSFSAYEVS
jgi:hypothetical protein